MTITDRTLDAPAALELAGPDCRVAVVARREGAVVQPDLAGHDDDAILAAGDLDVAPMAVGSAVAAPDASTLEVEVPAGSGPGKDELVDVRVETPAGLWSGPGTIVAVAEARARDHRRLTITIARPLAARARRSRFRFPLPEDAEIAAALWPMAEPAATRTPSDPDFEPRAIAPLGIAGRALELGGGGAGVVMPTAELEWLDWFDRFLLGLGRPGRPNEAAIRTTVRIASRVDRDDETTRLGLEFEVARSSGSPQHAYLYVEVLKLIEAVGLAECRTAA